MNNEKLCRFKDANEICVSLLFTNNSGLATLRTLLPEPRHGK